VRVDVQGEPPIRLTRVQSGLLDETQFSSGGNAVFGAAINGR
jgi:hypothetical protein